MHLPEGLLTPAACAATSLAATCGLGVAMRRLDRGTPARTVVLTGVVAAFVFAAQMVNFPMPLGFSGHLLGGMLAAVILGPSAAALAIAAVLVVQCLMFGDGGLSTLGANVFNMAIVGVGVGWMVSRWVRSVIPGPRGILIGAMIGAWLSVIAASTVLAFELALTTGAADFPRLLGWILLVHAMIGVAEALITGFVLRAVLLTRPELLVEQSTDAPPRSWPTWIGGGLAMAMAVAVFLAPIASSLDDGLEWTLRRFGLTSKESSLIAAPISDYQMPGVTAALGLATSTAGIAGSLAVFIAAIALARVFVGPIRASRRDEGSCAHAG